MSANQISWNFDHSYLKLPAHAWASIAPTPVRAPQLVILNKDLGNALGLNFDGHADGWLAQVFSGNELPEGAEPLAQSYAGHQFGHFTMLGDGRAHLLGEHITPDGQRVDIQLKGSGQTPYSRRGDGRAALGPMLREYIVSEAMHALKIPTTRSLAVVTTGEPVYREDTLQGAILTRVAASHLRVGTFEYMAAQKDKEGLKQLTDYAIDRHYPHLKASKSPYLDFIKAVIDQQTSLIIDWLRVGFIHGVMNTDNMTISGETIDYGPCAFMDAYDPNTVFSSIDQQGRYAYANQPRIAQWNLARFVEALLPLLHNDLDTAITIAEETVHSFSAPFQAAWLDMMRKKLGLFGQQQEDEQLIADLLGWMQSRGRDYTNTFRDLMAEGVPDGAPYHANDFKEWWQRWQQRLEKNEKPFQSALRRMQENNPAIIPRNHKVEEALSAAEENLDFGPLQRLLKMFAQPYVDKEEYKEFRTPPKLEERVYQTFCGT